MRCHASDEASRLHSVASPQIFRVLGEVPAADAVFVHVFGRIGAGSGIYTWSSKLVPDPGCAAPPVQKT